MKGPKPTTTARRMLRGTPSKEPLNTAEPHPATTAAAFEAAPRELAGNATAAAEWRRLVPLLTRCGQITDADRSVLIAACVEWSYYVAAISDIAARGLVLKAPRTGVAMINPFRSVAARALAGCLRLWPELGLTPSSRTRLTTTPFSPGEDPFREFEQPFNTPQ
jgi:P27 family predicted phage terminase small subunit